MSEPMTPEGALGWLDGILELGVVPSQDGVLDEQTSTALRLVLTKAREARRYESTLRRLDAGLDAAGQDPYCEGDLTARDLIGEVIPRPGFIGGGSLDFGGQNT